LGSCVAACLFDPESGVGGMNHFMLPSQSPDARNSARYGIHSMELLINAIMRLGGDRRRLRAKAFGGANVLRLNRPGLDVGQQNCQFIREFLDTEKIPLLVERLGGESPVRVHFLTNSGRAFVKVFPQCRSILETERRYREKAVAESSRVPNDNVTLF
jgi:chemotaxis receptor (MCP) glutamine deamidase CheD